MNGRWAVLALLVAAAARAEVDAPLAEPFEFPSARQTPVPRLLDEEPSTSARAGRLLTELLAGAATVATTTATLHQLVPKQTSLWVTFVSAPAISLSVTGTSWLLGGKGALGWTLLASMLPNLLGALLLNQYATNPWVEPGVLAAELVSAVAVTELTSWLNEREWAYREELSLLNDGAAPPVSARRHPRGLLAAALIVEWLAAAVGLGVGMLGAWAASGTVLSLCTGTECSSPRQLALSPVTMYFGNGLAALLVNAAGGWWGGWGTSWATFVGALLGGLLTTALVPLIGPWAIAATPFFAVLGYEVSAYANESAGAFAPFGHREGLLR